MSTSDLNWYSVLPLRDVDLLDMQLEARLCGLRTPGSLTQSCETFDDAVEGRPVRKYGRIDFDKTTRRWTAEPCAGATPDEVAALLWLGCALVRKYGSKPGQGLRDRVWRHSVGKDSHRYAFLFVARYVDKSELLELTLSEALDDMLDWTAPHVIDVNA